MSKRISIVQAGFSRGPRSTILLSNDPVGRLESAGLLDWLAPGAIVVAEWPERAPRAWPDDRLAISFARGAGEEECELEVRAAGPGSAALFARWRSELRTGPATD